MASGHGTAREENGEFCVVPVAHVTMTVGIMTYRSCLRRWLLGVDFPSGSYASLIGFNHRRLKVPIKGMSPHEADLAVYTKSSSYLQDILDCHQSE